MATGGIPAVRNSASEPRARGVGNGAPSHGGNRQQTNVDDIFRFNWIGDEDKPNNYWNWKPSATFAAPATEPHGKKTKTKNKDRDKRGTLPKENQGLTPAQTGSRDKHRHSPATYPRTQFVSSARERAELETLKQELTFSDVEEQSVDSQARGVSGAAGPIAVNNAQKNVKRPAVLLMNGPLKGRDDTTASAGATASRSRNTTFTTESNLLLNEMPDRNQIVARLMQIRDYIKQASAMVTNLEQNRTSGRAGDEQVEKLLRLREHLQDQEKGYLALLERMLAEETGETELHVPLETGRNSQNSGESFGSSAARSASINLDARSDISEATTAGTFTACTRPRIESHLGYHTSSENEFDSDSENGDEDACSEISSQASTGMISGLDTQELHEQFSAMLRKYQGEVVDFEASTETEDEGRHVALNGPRGIPEGSTTDETTEDDVDKRVEELAGLRQQHDLLKTMLQQQEELRALQSRQEALMKLQEDIEGRLQRSEHSKAETTEEEMASQSTMHSLPSQQDMDLTLKASSSAAVLPAMAAVDDEKVARQRRDVLMSLVAEDRDRRTMELEQARTLDRIAQQEAELNAMSSQRQSLQDKVEALQMKKQQMDGLLSQFQELRPILGQSEEDSESSVASSTNVNETPKIVGSPGGDAPQQAEEAEARDKLRRLHEVHHRLNELKDLVQHYQGIGEEAPELPTTEAAADSAANYEDPELMSNLRQLENRRQPERFQTCEPNIKVDEVSHHTITEDTMSQQQSEDETTTENATNTEDETESTQSSILALWGDDPEIREKVRKLQAAKQKLHQLQDLVAMVQHTPEVMDMLPDDLAELALSFDDFSEQLDNEDNDDEEENEDEEEGEGEDEQEEEGVSEMSEGEVPPPVSRQTREAYFEAKMQQQRSELEKLVEERHRLLSVQDQLRELNHRLPNAAVLPRAQANTITAKTQNTERNSRSPRNQLLRTTSAPVATMTASGQPTMRQNPTPTRDDVAREMMKHRRLQLELQQKKEELSSLLERVKGNNMDIDGHSELTYSVTSDMGDNDLFSRVSMRSADVTAAGTWGGSTQASEDDAYPSDGIVQVEEEEEQDGTSIAGSADTYTIEADYRNGVRRQRKFCGRETDADFDATHGVRYPKWSPRLAYGVRRQENVRSAEELMAEAGRSPGDFQSRSLTSDPAVWQVQQMQTQLANSMNMCQALMRDQQAMSSLLQSSVSGGYGGLSSMATLPTPLPTPDPGSGPHFQQMVQDYNLRLQHQQLQLNLNNAYNQMYNQRQEIHRMYERLQGNNPPSSNAGSDREGSNLNNNRSSYSNPYDYTSPYSRPPNMVPPYNQSSGYPFRMNPTFPANFASAPTQTKPTNQYSQLNDADSQRDYDAFARYRADRENYDGEDYHIPPNTATGSVDRDSVDQEYRRQEQENIMGTPTTTYPGLADLYRLDFTNASYATPASKMAAAEGGRPNQRNIPPIDIKSLLKKSEKQRRRRERVVKEPPKPLRNPRAVVDESTNTRRGSAAGAKAKLAAHSKRSPKYAWGPRPGLSAAISGTAFMDTESLTSTMSFSSMPGDLDGGGTPKHPVTRRSIKSTSEMESDAGSEFSLFEALRESIYSEVATLISQNETRPHFLIELFRELQMLTTDYLRQRALYALQDLVSKFLTEDSVRTAPRPAATSTDAVFSQRRPPWQLSNSEHTPSESYITSEDDEMKAQLFNHGSSKKHRGKISGRKEVAGSLASEQYDYMENIESASEISTPTSTGPGDFGFANDELGDTVIHLDKALQRMREYERLKIEAETAASGAGAAQQRVNQKEDATSTDVTSNSSAQDMGSESSFSDLPYPRIDTRQLDLQIKSIMQEVIPYLKEHMDDVCSPQLLSYIRRLVLTLARQRDDSREFVRFFNRQLGSILQDSLAKFSGRKMRECGEDLLVDISEILFNELAFFRLMQDLDTTGNKLQKEANEEEANDEEEEEEVEEEGDGATETATETETGQEDETNEDDTSCEEEEGETEDDTPASPSAQQPLTVSALAAAAAVTPDEQNAIESFMNDASQKEEEDLGKNRDDDLAARVEISDRDEDSEVPHDKDQVNIALSMSESIAVTYLGSGEEDNDLDSVSEAVDETITSIGAAGAEIETEPESQQTVDFDPALSSLQMNGDIRLEEETTPKEEEPVKEDASLIKETHKEKEELASAKETNGDEEKEKADGEGPNDDLNGAPMTEDVVNQDSSSSSSGGGVDANYNEVTLDDLPAKGLIASLSQVEIEVKMSEEQTNNSAVQAAMETIPDGEAELAGDPHGLKEPDTGPVQDGTSLASGDIGSE